MTCCVCLHRVVVAWIGGDSWIGGHSCGLGGTRVDWGALVWIGGHSCGLGGIHVDWGAFMWIGGYLCSWVLMFVYVCIVRACVRACVHVPERQGEGEKCMWQ